MKNQKQAYLFGLSAVLIWSTVASAFKIALTHLNPIQLLLCASVASSVALFVTIFFQRKVHLIFKTKKRDLLICSALGILNPFLYYMVLFKAYDLLPAQEAQSLNYTWAISLALLSIPLLGQKMSLRELMAIIVSYAGVLTISTRGDLLSMQFSNRTGVLLALLSTVIWALYWIYNTKISIDPVIGLFLSFCAGVPLIFLTTIIFSKLPLLNLAAIASSAYVGFFEMGITFVLWLKALKLTKKAARISNLIFLSPFISLVLIHYIVGENILPSTVAGLFLIIVGNVIQITSRGKNTIKT